MQDAQGYLDQKTGSPIGLGAALAINGALVGALLFASPEIREAVPKVFTARAIELVTPKPDPVPPPPHAQKDAPQQPRSAQTISETPFIPVEPVNSGMIEPYVPPVTDTSPGQGRIVTPILPHTPVFIGTRLDPRYAAQMQPDYPAGMQRRQIEGSVVVRVLVGPDGRVKDIRPVQASDDAFFRATADHARRRWRFQPATRDGTPVEAWRTMTVHFRLDD